MVTNEEEFALSRPNMAVGTSRCEVPLGLLVGTRLSQPKVAVSLGLGLVPMVSPNLDWDRVLAGTEQEHHNP